MASSKQILLRLIRIASGNDSGCIIPPDFNRWQRLSTLSSIHGVSALSVDGLSEYMRNGGEPLSLDTAEFEDVKFEWFGSLCQVEEEYDNYKTCIAQLAEYYRSIGVKMLVLKGYGVGLDWPVPSHRPVGDIDIWLFGKQKEADQRISKDLGIEIDNSHHHHSVFSYKGLMVENHYNFVNVFDKPSSRRIEKRLKLLASDCLATDMENVYLPTADFNALFLIRHCAGHFSSAGIKLRQLLDWLFFVRAHHEEIDWDALYDVLRKENMYRFANSLNSIGVIYFGFDQSIFPELENDRALVDRIMKDILTPEFKQAEDGSLLSGLTVKPKRWWHNRWKYKICYPDNLFVSFLFNFAGKLMKPKHFIH